MNELTAGILVSAEDSIPNEWIEEFTTSARDLDVNVQVETREGGPSAGMDWLLRTAVAIVLGTFIKEASQDAYQGLKAALRHLADRLRQRTTTTLATGREKVSDDSPGPLTIALEDGAGSALRFVFPSDPDQQAVALEAFFQVLDDEAHQAALLSQFARAQEQGFEAWKIIARFDPATREWTVEAPLSGDSWPIE